jgi:hypothetical protein
MRQVVGGNVRLHMAASTSNTSRHHARGGRHVPVSVDGRVTCGSGGGRSGHLTNTGTAHGRLHPLGTGRGRRTGRQEYDATPKRHTEHVLARSGRTDRERAQLHVFNQSRGYLHETSTGCVPCSHCAHIAEQSSTENVDTRNMGVPIEL